jgi:transcriptional regulator with XRE-family HTH domain
MRSHLCLTLIGMSETLTALGVLIERARAELRISAREAARRAGISPTRWRQVVTGEQIKNGRPVPVNPTARTVVAMALAVLADPAGALAAAGLTVPADLAPLIGDVQNEMRGQVRGEPAAGGVDLSGDEHRRLTDEIARIEGLRLPESAKLMMLEALIRAWERYAIERESRAGSAAG